LAHTAATDAAAADRKASICFPRHHRSGERHDEVGIVVVEAQRVSAEINDLMARRPELSDQLLLQPKSAVISGNAHTHKMVRFS
jgi:hypothetical protein